MIISNSILFTGEELEDYHEFAQAYRRQAKPKIIRSSEIVKIWRAHRKDNKRLRNENKRLRNENKGLKQQAPSSNVVKFPPPR